MPLKFSVNIKKHSFSNADNESEAIYLKKNREVQLIMSSQKIGPALPSNLTQQNNSSISAVKTPQVFSSNTLQTDGNKKITASSVVRKNESPFSDQHYALMKAAADAGLPPEERKAFADANTSGNLVWNQGSDPTPKTDRTARPEDYKLLIGKTKSYNLSSNQVADLQRRVTEYKAKGGKLFSNREVLQNPMENVAARNGIGSQNISEAAPTDGITASGNTPPTRFSVLLNNNGKPITNERILAQFVEDRYKGGNLWGENFREIAQMSIAQDVKPTDINRKGNVGNKVAVYFVVSVTDQKKIHENYKIVQEKVNEIEKIVESTKDNMALNQFLKGVGEGAWENLKQNWHMLTHPIETVQGILDAVKTLTSLTKEDVGNIIEQLKQSGKDLIYKDDPSEVAHKAGKIVGAAAAEILLGKGIGIALKAIKGITAVETLLTKVDDLAKAAKVKILVAFSDEAAEAAVKRLLSNNKLYAVLPGAPLPPKVIADFGIVIGNKVGKGVTSFRQIVKEMSAELGEAVKPHLDKLAKSYRETMKKAGLKADENEIITIFKEWEVERAKNINDSMNISDVSEITSKGYVDRQALRRQIGQADYPNYRKHIKAKTYEDARKFSLGEAQFLPEFHKKLKGLYQEGIENAISNGLLKKEGGTWYFFHKFEKPVGFYKGEEVKWIRIELTDSSKSAIHGHPISLERVRTYFPEIKGSK